ncbi:MAG TPA: hypothetical protein DIT99_23790 [Candidatus Latescibacteria bacterium]|nr:hypothetical protein [Candidatus Latescibacterota bacterium]
MEWIRHYYTPTQGETIYNIKAVQRTQPRLCRFRVFGLFEQSTTPDKHRRSHVAPQTLSR